MTEVPSDGLKDGAKRAAGNNAAWHIPSLDGIRALSFLMVFVAHAGLDAVVPGGFGVTVFFFLSGYLITTLLRVEYDQFGTVSLKNFYLRRILRIWPAFYLVLLLAVALTMLGLVEGSLRVAPLAAQALNVGNYWIIYHGVFGLPAGTGVYWSLAVEARSTPCESAQTKLPSFTAFA